ncbi:hypothetical protein HK414_16260 [Ramlibacter terrae]|uniref:FAD-binding domain-containing protein n=1 Tax=Ramlibacter terrae TaxID=2732511 RepID=A0ABX6P6Y4_9BURK|nr:hypothetical protein HK414_16260 [Ramlibacter terrae]
MRAAWAWTTNRCAASGHRAGGAHPQAHGARPGDAFSRRTQAPTRRDRSARPPVRLAPSQRLHPAAGGCAVARGPGALSAGAGALRPQRRVVRRRRRWRRRHRAAARRRRPCRRRAARGPYAFPRRLRRRPQPRAQCLGAALRREERIHALARDRHRRRPDRHAQRLAGARPGVSIRGAGAAARHPPLRVHGATRHAGEHLRRPGPVRALLARVLPQARQVRLIRHRVYTHHARIAPTFRRGNVFIAGDAAHLMPVWQGQGFNTGIRDATNLAWKLALVVRGRAAPGLLDSYTQERHAHAAAMIDLSVLVGKIFVPSSKALRLLRDIVAPRLSRFTRLRQYIAEMRFKPMPFPAKGAVVHRGRPDPRAPIGRMFVQPRVRTAAGEVLLFDDAVGPRFVLLSWSARADAWITPAAAAVLATLDAARVVVRPDCRDLAVEPPAGGIVVADAEGGFRAWFDAAPGSVVVLRPDKVVAAVCNPCELDDVLAQLARVLHLQAPAADAVGQRSPSSVVTA